MNMSKNFKEVMKEFDEKYSTINWRGEPAKQEVKSFLKQKLIEQRKETLDEFEKKVVDMSPAFLPPQIQKGYSLAIKVCWEAKKQLSKQEEGK